MMAQREATQTEAKRKAAEREANKETRRKEKEELAEHMRIMEERAAKKLDREQAEAECRARRYSRQVGVGAGGGREPTVTGGRSSASAGWDGGTATVQGGSAAVDGGACRRPSTGASLPRDPNVLAMLRPDLSPPRIFHDHPSSQEMVSTAWALHFHGSLNSSFLFNPVMAMQQMLPHPTGFTHNGNPAWLPQVGMTGGSDVRPAAEFIGGRFLAPDRASTAP